MNLDKYFVMPDEEDDIQVLKRNGSVELFDEKKLQSWITYASRNKDVDPFEIYRKTKARIPVEVSSQEIQEILIQVCLDKENIEYSRVAARLLYGSLRKNLSSYNLCDKMSFEELYNAYKAMGLWTFELTDVEWANEVYELVYKYKLEYWQIRQWMDKYSLQYGGEPVETPHSAILAMSISLHGCTPEALNMVSFVLQGIINLPTPVLNGCRNGDYDSISCSVIQGTDTVESIGVATHLAYSMTAKKAGIGIRIDTRSTGDAVKGGRVKHLGKVPIYGTVDKAVKMFTQVTRGGSATVTYSVYDPQILELLNLKSQRTPENRRIDKLDYSLAYDDYFIHQVIHDQDIELVSMLGTVHTTIKAREVLKAFLTVRQETGRVYAINLDTTNKHTPFHDYIYQSNLCMEIALPTYPYKDMKDLYSEHSYGEMAFCTLCAINVGSKYYYSADLVTVYEVAVLTLNRIIDKVGMFSPSLKNNLEHRRSLGIGITGLAEYLHNNNLTYADNLRIEELAEFHYALCLQASQSMVSSYGYKPVEGIDVNWLPFDTKVTNNEPKLKPLWEVLRGKPRANSVLVAHMPCESSAIFSNATNGLYPVRNKVINKQSRKGAIQYLAPDVNELAWDIDTPVLLKAYAAVAAYTDQAISADTYVTPSNYEGNKVPMSKLMKEFVLASKLGIKTLYYVNTNDNLDAVLEDDGCDTCKM